VDRNAWSLELKALTGQVSELTRGTHDLTMEVAAKAEEARSFEVPSFNAARRCTSERRFYTAFAILFHALLTI
jgi:hypothetical protein